MIAGRVARFMRWTEIAMASVAGVAVLFIMGLSVAEIILRGAFNAPIHGFVDVVILIMPVIALFGISLCLRTDTHVRMALLIEMLPPAGRSTIEAMGAALGALTSFALAYGGWEHFLRALAYNDTTPTLNLLTWPSKLAVSLCLGLLGVRFVLYTIGYARAALGNSPPTDGELLPEPPAGSEVPKNA